METQKTRIAVGDLGVPFQEVRLTNGEVHRLYDTAGPATAPTAEGLGKRRASWRSVSDEGTQRSWARAGIVTEEMRFVAIRENVAPELVRSEVARGPRGHPREQAPPRARADGHRAPLPLQDQREHRQLRGRELDRGGGREAPLVGPVRRRHRDGPLHRRRHRRDARGDHRATAPCPSAPCRSTECLERGRRAASTSSTSSATST